MLSSYIKSSLKSRKFAVVVFAFLLLISPFFFIGGPTPESTALFRTLWDCGHILFFMGLIIVLRTRVNIEGWRPCLFISVIVFIVGGAIEIIQAHVGRDGNWQDLLRDLTGTWLGLFWLQRHSAWAWIGRVTALALLMPSVWLVGVAAVMQWQSAQHFPLLAGFEYYVDQYHWKGDVEISSEQHTQGMHSLKIYLTTQRHSGVAFKEYLGDWRGYKTMSFNLYNPNDQVINLVLRINDVQHENGPNLYNDRFNRNLTIEHGWNHMEIPLNEVEHAPASRLMDMQRISSIVIFAVQLREPQIIYIDNVVLF